MGTRGTVAAGGTDGVLHRVRPIRPPKPMKPRRMRKATIAAGVAEAGRAARRQWRALPLHRRQRLQELVRLSAGRPGNLSAGERQELWTLLRELNLGEALRHGAARASARHRDE